MKWMDESEPLAGGGKGGDFFFWKGGQERKTISIEFFYDVFFI